MHCKSLILSGTFKEKLELRVKLAISGWWSFIEAALMWYDKDNKRHTIGPNVT